MRDLIRRNVNNALAHFNVRLVNSEWGPRGHVSAFRRLRDLNFKAETIWDVGASDGTWSLELSNIFTDARYLLFEPLPDCQAALESLVSERKNFRRENLALGKSRETLFLNQHAGQSSLLESSQWQGQKTAVEVETIDNLIINEGYPLPTILKADIQGYELKLLQGGTETLEQISFLFFEVSWFQIYENGCTAGEIIGHLETRGFQVFDICSYSTRPSDHRLMQSDILFANKATGLFSDKRWF